jgi:adenosylhomocysteine nucleosidase
MSTTSPDDESRPTPSWNVGAYAAGGGTVNVGGDAVGSQWNLGARAPRTNRQETAGVGVLTVLAEETSAVVQVLRRHRDYWSEQLYGGQQVHGAVVNADGGELRVVAVQTLDRGPESAAVAYGQLQKVFGPPLVLLVGIAGGIRAGLAVGDVVIADEVIYYDARRETSDGPHRRGHSQPMTPVLRHRVNDFFWRYGESIKLTPKEEIRLHRGPIGSGNAVITDAESDVITFLRTFNEKVLAVETEAGGVGQAFYERIDGESPLQGWLTIRGISDLADRHKGHHRHRFAAERAALVMDRLLPHLRLTERPR